jgi:glutamine phosphoribosylpyrophosphate amidotransferase
MCSIVGWNGVYNKDLVEKIMQNSRVRGLHAFGYSYYKNGVLTTKKFLKYKEFIDEINQDKPNKFIAHFRYSTSGEYTNQSNNQPITSLTAALAFNGVIDMGNKEEMESKYNCSLTTDNDGELVLKKFEEDTESVKEFIQNKTFAGIFLTSNKIIAIRNANRPAYIAEKNGAKIICSTKDIMNRSGIVDVVTLKTLEYYEI